MGKLKIIMENENIIIHKTPEIKNNVVYTPWISGEMINEEREKYNQFMIDYHKQHRVCPKCGSRDYRTTLLGFIFDERHPEDYKDKNSCQCNNCGWNGIVHNLVPEK